MPTTLTNGIQLPDKGSVDWYSSMQSNYNLIDTHLGNTDTHVTAEDKANWNSKQGSLSQAQLDAIAQVATNTSDIATLQSGKANASHTHSSSDITDIDDYATKQYVDNSISGLVDNAPDALNTLNELSAALNDDSNFASTVTTALADKANSSDLATVATSGSYDDLTDTPTIPTKTSDLTNDSNFVVSSNLATVATSGDYDDLSNKPSIPINTSDLNNDSGFVTLNDFDIPAKTSDLTNDSGFITSSDVPTSTSDLINDSNFVDTSNSAVASGITSAKVTDYDNHIADTDIHVTTADKNKWNNGVTQAYVFRYSSTALVASSTNSNTLLDNTDNLKVGDKVIDSSGVLFSVTAIDTVNSTFTIGTALIDLAQDSDVVHKSGNETVGGNKTFTGTNEIIRPSGDHKLKITDTRVTPLNPTESITSNITWQDSTGRLLGTVANVYDNSRNSIMQLYARSFNANGEQESHRLRIIANKGGDSYADVDVNFLPSADNRMSLGSSTLRWNGVYATNYYYGANNVEFSTKFVTTDTAQTISGNKTFSSNTYVYNSDNTATTPNLYLKSSKVEVSSQGNTSGDQNLVYLDKNNTVYAYVKGAVQSNGSAVKIRAVAKDSSDNSVINELQMLAYTNGNKAIFPSYSNEIDLGVSNYKWKSFNGIEPSSLSLPDLSNGIDISSYITVNGGNKESLYTPTVNGWISVALTRTSGSVAVMLKQGNLASSGHRIDQENGTATCNAMLPVKGGVQVSINSALADRIVSAYFYPCQGNV